MKKFFTIAILTALSFASFSQNVYDTLLMPHQIVARCLDASGEIISQYPATFLYNADGKFIGFNYPRRNVSAYFSYDNQYLSSIWMQVGSSMDEEYSVVTWNYVYENGLIQTEHKRTTEYYLGHSYSTDEYLYYNYDESGRLMIKELHVHNNILNDRWSYEYDHQGKTMIETHRGFWGGQSSFRMSESSYQYDDDYVLQEVQTELYDYNDGHLTQTTKQQYTYTEQGKLASKITQTLVDGEWVNSTIHQNLYDAYGKLSEQLDGSWSDSLNYWVITFKMVYEYAMSDNNYTVSFYKKNGEDWVWGNSYGHDILLDPELQLQQEMLNELYSINQLEFTTTYKLLPTFPEGSEWFYEIHGENGEITYQQLQCVGDTTINSERAKVIVRTNQIYDKDGQPEVTREYVYERDSVLYWWNKTLHEFTTLYDFAAEEGDEWEIKVGQESITVHVDHVGSLKYEDESYKTLSISDAGHVFDGDIICGIGHTTSFFPEKLMCQGKDYEVDGLRCYLVQDVLLYHEGDKDCDAISLYSVDEIETQGFVVYPNPTDGLLHIETSHGSSLPVEYRITNLLGQTLLSGTSPQIDVSTFPAGLYFITLGTQTLKFTKQ